MIRLMVSSVLLLALLLPAVSVLPSRVQADSDISAEERAVRRERRFALREQISAVDENIRDRRLELRKEEDPLKEAELRRLIDELKDQRRQLREAEKAIGEY